MTDFILKSNALILLLVIAAVAAAERLTLLFLVREPRPNLF
jgi:hypothetical protein